MAVYFHSSTGKALEKVELAKSMAAFKCVGRLVDNVAHHTW